MIRYGIVLFIPDAVGMTLRFPDGREVVHDGYYFAGDTGGAIRDDHVDYFIGTSEASGLPDFVKSHPTPTFRAYLVDGTTAKLPTVEAAQARAVRGFPRSTADLTTRTWTRRAVCSGSSRRSKAIRSAGPI